MSLVCGEGDMVTSLKNNDSITPAAGWSVTDQQSRYGDLKK